MIIINNVKHIEYIFNNKNTWHKNTYVDIKDNIIDLHTHKIYI